MKALKPAPLPAWFQTQAKEHAASFEAQSTRRFEAPPYRPETSVAHASVHHPSECINNGGTAALQALDRASRNARCASRSPEWPAFVRATLECTAAHLRNAGVGYVYDASHGTLTLNGHGPHPYNATVRALAAEAIAIKVRPEEAAEAEAVVFPGVRAIFIGFRELLALDPESPTLAHERFHVVTPKATGASPHAGLWVRGDGRTPGASHWEYADSNADEPAAYCAGLAARFDKLAAMIRNSGAVTERELRSMRGETNFGLQVTLRNIAVDKQMLSRLTSRDFFFRDARNFRIVHIAQHRPATASGFTPYDYEVRLRRSPLDALLTGIDAYFARPGEATWLTRARLRQHFDWQLRSVKEHLAMLRVAAQALDAVAAEPSAELCERVAVVLRSARTGESRRASGLTYEEALSIANGSARADS